jgi:serine/threonine protein kinase
MVYVSPKIASLLLQKMLQFDPAKRQTAAHLLKHAWFEPYLKEQQAAQAAVHVAPNPRSGKSSTDKHH